uniref:Uncharacterized protein n=1 Tax=Aegilops tauschii subsp. strangulata TaxID=200361 RepID=A0A452XN24_AEGTS
MMCYRQRELVPKKIDRFPRLLVAKNFESLDCRSTIDGHDHERHRRHHQLSHRQDPRQPMPWPPQGTHHQISSVARDVECFVHSLILAVVGTWQGLQAATPSADGIESVMFTYRFMEDQSTVFTDVQRSEASPCTGGCASTHTVDSAVNAPWIHEGPTADYCVRTGYREVHAAGVCPEAQLMAGSNSVIYLTNDEGPVVRLLRWVAGLCGGSDLAVHGCPEGQLMAGNSTIYQNGLVQWLLR